MKTPTEEQVQLARERLAYFEAQLEKERVDPANNGKTENDWPFKYYRTEIAERTMFLALWDHIMSPPRA